MAKPRACDVCSLRKIRCNGIKPCPACVKAGFECSFTKKPMKPGPKGPRAATCNRIKKQVQGIRSGAGPTSSTDVVKQDVTSERDATASSSPSSISQPSFFDSHPVPRTETILGQVASQPAAWASSLTLTDVYAYLKIYHYKMYPVWPVIDRISLTTKLRDNLNDPETCALAFSVCAATGAQLRLDAENSRPEPSVLPSGIDQGAMSDRFAGEAERYRSMYDYRERATTEEILIPLFLHFYYADKKKNLTSSLLLREAVTMCQLMNLDKENSYTGLPKDEQRYRRKIFWLLYITERGHAMQHDTSISLSNSIDLPTVEEDNEPLLFGAFLSLVELFVSVDGILIDSKDRSGRRKSVFDKKVLSQLQKKLRTSPQYPSQSSELQKIDIFVTQQWMRMLVWQLSMKNIYLSTNSGDEAMSLTYPAYVAKDSLSFLSRVSLDSLVAHGPGMEIKLFEIANTLLDVINVVPAMSHDFSLQTQTPRDIFHSLCCLLTSIGGDKSHGLKLLQSKMGESKLPFRRIPRVIEVQEPQVESPLSNDRNSSNSTADWEFQGASPAELGSVIQQSLDSSCTTPQWAFAPITANSKDFVSMALVPNTSQVYDSAQMPWAAF